MISVTYSSLREKLKTLMDHSFADHEEVLITRKNGANMVLLSEIDYNAMKETAYLMRNPYNAKRLIESIKSLEKRFQLKEVQIKDLEG